MGDSTENLTPSKVAKPSTSSTRIMRLITACSRCRSKKVKCDRKFPTCTNCSKADTPCVIKDPSTGEEVSRFTIHGLETRLQEVTEELNALKMERLAHAQGQPGPSQSGLTFGKVLLMKDTDVREILSADPSAMGIPPRDLVETCLISFFTVSNVQVPIVHRDYYFFKYFRPLYETVGPSIWKGILGDHFDPQRYSEEPHNIPMGSNMWQKCLFFLHIFIAISTSQRQQKYPLSISNHHKNEAFKYVDYIWREADGADGSEIAKLEMLQSLLLLTQYSLMRPCSPGAWYLIGTCVRLCQDLGLHNESLYLRSQDKFIVDLRRRLFWSCYSLDRQISIYFGRPFGLNSRQIDCPFFSSADDSQLSPDSEAPYPVASWLTGPPTTRDITIHFIILRIIQGDLFDYINDIGNRVPNRDASMSEEDWLQKIRQHDAWKDQKYAELVSWFKKSPINRDGISPFNEIVFKLNLNQSIIQIYGLSAITPLVIHSHHHQMLFDAGKEIIWTYVELTERKLINFSWVAINNLYLGGSAYLTSISLSSQLRDNLSPAELRKDCAGVMMVFEELCKICFEPANGYSKKFEAHSRSVIEQCQREREARGVAGMSSQIVKGAAESNVFTSMGGSTPAQFVVPPQHHHTDKDDDSTRINPSHEYFDHFGGLYESEELVKKMIGSIDASHEGMFEGIETEDSFLGGSYA